jgi:hypothetical protein
VAEGVVVELEPVEVEHDERQRPLATGPADAPGQVAEQAAPVA